MGRQCWLAERRRGRGGFRPARAWGKLMRFFERNREWGMEASAFEGYPGQWGRARECGVRRELWRHGIGKRAHSTGRCRVGRESLLHPPKSSTSALTQPLPPPTPIHSQVHKVGQNCPGFGRHLNGLFKQAVTAGKRVRAETSISSGAVSVSSAAAELAQLKLPTHDFNDAKVCIIGAGKMSKLLVKHLSSKGCKKVVVLNRR